MRTFLDTIATIFSEQGIRRSGKVGWFLEKVMMMEVDVYKQQYSVVSDGRDIMVDMPYYTHTKKAIFEMP